MVTRAEAWRIPQAHVGEHQTVSKVFSFEEFAEMGERQPAVHMPWDWEAEDFWVACAGSIFRGPSVHWQ